MSLAITFGDLQSTDESKLKGVIYFDAVTLYTKDYSGKVTSHPIEAGASVSDHFVSDNPKFQISGVLSHVDFPVFAEVINKDESLGAKITNYTKEPSPTRTSNLGSGLRQFLPGVIDQFLPRTPVTVTMDGGTNKNYRMEITDLLSRLMTELYFNEARGKYENRMTPISLYEINETTPEKPITDLIMTGFTVKEDESTGQGMFLDLSFEKVMFVTSEKAEAPNVNKTQNKGKQPSTEQTATVSEQNGASRIAYGSRNAGAAP